MVAEFIVKTFVVLGHSFLSDVNSDILIKTN